MKILFKYVPISNIIKNFEIALGAIKLLISKLFFADVDSPFNTIPCSKMG